MTEEAKKSDPFADIVVQVLAYIPPKPKRGPRSAPRPKRTKREEQAETETYGPGSSPTRTPVEAGFFGEGRRVDGARLWEEW